MDIAVDYRIRELLKAMGRSRSTRIASYAVTLEELDQIVKQNVGETLAELLMAKQLVVPRPLTSDLV